MDLNVKNQMLLDQKHQVLGLVDSAGDALDTKASALVQSGAVLLGVAGLLTTLGLVNESQLSAVDLVALVLVALAFGAAVWAANRVAAPSTHILPGAYGEGAWNRMFERYLHVSEAESFDKMLSDYQNAIDKGLARNDLKALWLRRGNYALLLMTAGLVIAAIF